MKHQDPTCKRIIDDDTRFVTFMNSRAFFFCSEECKHSFEHARDLYTVKRVDHDQRKVYKVRPNCRPVARRW
ncbi:MAG: hypothetical protein Q6373_017805 [Candidatus Sigynarchaeota archaeon]